MAHTRLKLAVLLAISTLLGLCLGEALLTLRWKDRHSNLVLADGFDSPFLFRGAADSVVEEGGFEYRLNNLGMRRESDVSSTPPPGTFRILAYGDSITNGWGVAVGDTYSQRLESALNRQGHRRYEVLNMYRGVSPTIASFHLRQEVPRLEPDGVLLQIELLNDTSDEALVLTRGRDRDGLPEEMVRGRYILGWDGHLLTPLAVSGSFVERTKVWALVTQQLGRLRSAWEVPLGRSGAKPRFDGSDAYFYNLGFDRYRLGRPALADGFERMFDSLAGIHRFLSRQGVRTLIVILPSRFAFEHPRYQAAALQALRRAEREAIERSLPFVSPYDTLGDSGGADLFMDFCHPNAAGNRVIAAAVLEAVRAW